MTPSALEYLDRAWEITVLPQPNAPGMEHVPGASGRGAGEPWAKGEWTVRVMENDEW
jgi:hypothetical protein